MKEQVVTYLSDNKLICDEYSAYLPGHFTQLFVYYLMQNSIGQLTNEGKFGSSDQEGMQIVHRRLTYCQRDKLQPALS